MRWYLSIGFLTLLGGIVRAQVTERVSVTSTGSEANDLSVCGGISDDGRYVVFSTSATNYVQGDDNGVGDVMVRDRGLGTTELVSAAVDGTPANGDSYVWRTSMSADGRFVVFESNASDIVPVFGGDTYHVYVRDRLTGTTEIAGFTSSGVAENGGSDNGMITPDGRFLVFQSDGSNLVAGDTNHASDVFLRDRMTGAIVLVSISSSGVLGNGASAMPSLSADGRFVAFQSSASNLVAGDNNGCDDIFLRDLQAGTTKRVSQLTSSGAQHDSSWPVVSADGRHVVFVQRESGASDPHDIFVYDDPAGTISQLTSNWSSDLPSISADGRFVSFVSGNAYIVPADTNGCADAFVLDRERNLVERADVDSNGAQANDGTSYAVFTPNGRLLVFDSRATNLVPQDTNGTWDVFVRDLQPAEATPFCFGDGTVVPCPCGNNGSPLHGCANTAAGWTGGSILTANGSASLSNDTLRMTSYGESYAWTHAMSALFQGDTAIAPEHYGDGLRCVGGNLKRLYARDAVGGVVTLPQSGDPSMSARSAALGDALSVGATRYYQVQYRDRADWFCPSPQGNTWNVSSGLSVVWAP